MKSMRLRGSWCVAVAISAALFSVVAAAQSARKPIDPEKARIAAYWTPERRAAAIPRDLVIDPRGLGYLRRPDGTLVPYGHNIEAQVGPRAQTPVPFAKPTGGASKTSDTNPPVISNMDPAGGTIGASYPFSATVTDAESGVKSVTFKIQYPNGLSQSFSASPSGDTWSVNLSGFTDGDWAWSVIAKDNAPRGGNTATEGPVAFTVKTGSGGGTSGGGGTVTNAEWTNGGAVQTAAGRLYFEMPSNSKWKGPWTGYVCSGTVVADGTTGRSVILTASHCVYDDVNKAFARNVMFIPNQAGTTGTGTDLNCGNDPMGCWVPSFGVVDVNWTTRTFPDNILWDYAFYVVPDSGAHQTGFTPSSDILDTAASSLSVQTDTNATVGAYAYALGYSYSEDPKFMYCAENLGTESSYGDWWLGSCGLSGGSSGGPWVQNADATNTWTGGTDGKIISVNSWGYTNQPGMAGPKLFGTSASCVFGNAKSGTATSTQDGYAGIKASCSP